MKNMWIFNTIKFRIFEKFVLSLGYLHKSQEWSHIKYEYKRKVLIIPKHKEISRWTVNNIFKIISHHLWVDKKVLEKQFLEYYKKC